MLILGRCLPFQLTATIKQDLNLSATEVANSNIVSLCATYVYHAAAKRACKVLTYYCLDLLFVPSLVLCAINSALEGSLAVSS